MCPAPSPISMFLCRGLRATGASQCHCSCATSWGWGHLGVPACCCEGLVAQSTMAWSA